MFPEVEESYTEVSSAEFPKQFTSMEDELQYYKKLAESQANQIKKLKKAAEVQREVYEEKLEVKHFLISISITFNTNSLLIIFSMKKV